MTTKSLQQIDDEVIAYQQEQKEHLQSQKGETEFDENDADEQAQIAIRESKNCDDLFQDGARFQFNKMRSDYMPREELQLDSSVVPRGLLEKKINELRAQNEKLVAEVDKIIRNPVLSSHKAIYFWEAVLAEFNGGKRE